MYCFLEGLAHLIQFDHTTSSYYGLLTPRIYKPQLVDFSQGKDVRIALPTVRTYVDLATITNALLHRESTGCVFARHGICWHKTDEIGRINSHYTRYHPKLYI
jgi:hypothetical protein